MRKYMVVSQDLTFFFFVLEIPKYVMFGHVVAS